MQLTNAREKQQFNIAQHIGGNKMKLPSSAAAAAAFFSLSVATLLSSRPAASSATINNNYTQQQQQRQQQQMASDEILAEATIDYILSRDDFATENSDFAASDDGYLAAIAHRHKND